MPVRPFSIAPTTAPPDHVIQRDLIAQRRPLLSFLRLSNSQNMVLNERKHSVAIEKGKRLFVTRELEIDFQCNALGLATLSWFPGT